VLHDLSLQFSNAALDSFSASFCLQCDVYLYRVGDLGSTKGGLTVVVLLVLLLLPLTQRERIMTTKIYRHNERHAAAFGGNQTAQCCVAMHHPISK
jgi:hypothetical protein